MKRSVYAGPTVNRYMEEAGDRGGSARLEAVARRFAWVMERSAPILTQDEWTRLLRVLVPARDVLDANPQGMAVLYGTAHPQDAELYQRLMAMKPWHQMFVVELVDAVTRDPELDFTELIPIMA